MGELELATQLQERCRFLEPLVEPHGEALVAADSAGLVVFWSPRAESLCGWTDAEVCGRPLLEVLFPALGPDAQRVVRGLETWSGTLTCERRGNLSFEARVSLTPLLGASDALAGHVYVLAAISEREGAEAALAESEQRYRGIFEDSGVGMTLFDSEGRFLSVNPAACMILGYSAEELLTMSFPEVTHPQDLDSSLEAYQSALQAGLSTYTIEKRYLRKDGTTVWGILTVSFFRGRSSAPAGLAQLCDVTERMQAKSALEESEARNSLLSRLAQEAIVIHDRGILLEANDRFFAMMGYEPEELRGQDVLSYTSSTPDVLASVRTRIAAGDLGPYETLARRKNGESFHVEIMAEPIEFRGREVRATVLRDITQRKEAESVLLARERDLLWAQRAAGLGSWTFDPDTSECSWTEGVFLIYGLDSSLGTPPLAAQQAFLPPEDWERLSDAVQAALLRGEPYELQYRLRRPNGEERVVVSNCSPELDAAGRTIRLTGTLRDITERLQAEAEQAALEAKLRQAQKLESLGVLASGIAHDFNNLLVSLYGGVDAALTELADDAPVRPHLTRAKIAGERAADLIQQMMAYAGQARPARERVDLNAVVQETEVLIRASISKKIVLALDLGEDLPRTLGGASQTQQVIMNLVLNAAEAVGGEVGEVSMQTAVVRLEREALDRLRPESELPAGEYLQLEVTDTGCGMSEETRARVFEPFFSTKPAGRGLGLATVYGIVRQYQGAIQVESAPAAGTTFAIYLPAAPAAGPAPSAPPPTNTDAWRGSGTILVIDDEESVRGVASAVLSRLGFTVLVAVDGREGLAVFCEHRAEICCVLLDLNMPVMGGAETYAAIRATGSEVPVILSSGNSEQEALRAFGDLGLPWFLQKPFRVVSLRDRVRDALEATP